MKELKGNDILNILLDENNKSDLVLTDVDGVEVVFEQLITIPYYNAYMDQEDIYCILHPKTDSREFSQAYVYPFKVIKLANGSYSLIAEDDEEIIAYLNEIYLEKQ